MSLEIFSVFTLWTTIRCSKSFASCTSQLSFQEEITIKVMNNGMNCSEIAGLHFLKNSFGSLPMFHVSKGSHMKMVDTTIAVRLATRVQANIFRQICFALLWWWSSLRFWSTTVLHFFLVQCLSFVDGPVLIVLNFISQAGLLTLAEKKAR